jgi:hypothetical protein
VPARFTVYIVASGGGGSESTTDLFNIVSTAKDFTLEASPSSHEINSLQAQSSQITALPINGMTGTISLSSNIVQNTGNGATCTLSPTSLTLGSSTSATLSCSVPNTAIHNFIVNVIGSNGTITRQVSIFYNIFADFTIAAQSTNLECSSSGSSTSASTTVAVTSINGFNQTLALDAIALPTNLTISLNPSTLAHGQGSSTVTISCLGVTPGTYTVSVRAAASYVQRSVQITVKVS